MRFCLLLTYFYFRYYFRFRFQESCGTLSFEINATDSCTEEAPDETIYFRLDSVENKKLDTSVRFLYLTDAIKRIPSSVTRNNSNR